MNLPEIMFAVIGIAAVFETTAFLRNRRLTRYLSVLAFLAVATVLARIWTLEAAQDAAMFGASDTGFSVMLAVGVMLVGICLGILARYIFEANAADPLNWFALLRPLVISPILLLPLIGTLDEGELQSLQVVSLAILAFQNGFFWQKVLAGLDVGQESALQKG